MDACGGRTAGQATRVREGIGREFTQRRQCDGRRPVAVKERGTLQTLEYQSLSALFVAKKEARVVAVSGQGQKDRPRPTDWSRPDVANDDLTPPVCGSRGVPRDRRRLGADSFDTKFYLTGIRESLQSALASCPRALPHRYFVATAPYLSDAASLKMPLAG